MQRSDVADVERRRTRHVACLLRAGVMLTEVLGWLSSCVLVMTIARQVWRQWQSGHSEGVSTWLFIGQMTASLGFTAYSFLVDNWVFVVTNALMFVSAVLGALVVGAHRRRGRSAPRSDVVTAPSHRSCAGV